MSPFSIFLVVLIAVIILACVVAAVKWAFFGTDRFDDIARRTPLSAKEIRGMFGVNTEMSTETIEELISYSIRYSIPLPSVITLAKRGRILPKDLKPGDIVSVKNAGLLDRGKHYTFIGLSPSGEYADLRWNNSHVRVEPSRITKVAASLTMKNNAGRG